jgi:hypothetical protein
VHCLSLGTVLPLPTGVLYVKLMGEHMHLLSVNKADRKTVLSRVAWLGLSPTPI